MCALSIIKTNSNFTALLNKHANDIDAYAVSFVKQRAITFMFYRKTVVGDQTTNDLQPRLHSNEFRCTFHT